MLFEENCGSKKMNSFSHAFIIRTTLSKIKNLGIFATTTINNVRKTLLKKSFSTNVFKISETLLIHKLRLCVLDIMTGNILSSTVAVTRPITGTFLTNVNTVWVDVTRQGKIWLVSSKEEEWTIVQLLFYYIMVSL